MSRIVLAWELGEGLGHLVRLSQLARVLAARGHEVTLIAKELAPLRTLLAGDAIRILPAPFAASVASPRRQVHTMADILLRRGYQQPATLQHLVNAWQQLFTLLQPDLVVLDYAPTAALALRGYSCRTLVFSNGYCAPATGFPLRSLAPGRGEGRHPLDGEEAVLRTINALLPEPLTQVAELFAADRICLADYPWFDADTEHRRQALYLGILPGRITSGLLAADLQRAATRPRVLAYLDLNYAGTDGLLRALARSGAEIWCQLPAAQRAAAQNYASPQLHWVTDWLDFPACMARVDLVACHGNLGTVAQGLIAGRPLLMLPGHLEQWHNAQRIQQAGAGCWLPSTTPVSQWEQSLLTMLNASNYATAAQRIGRELAAIAPSDPWATLLDVCEDLLTH